MPNKLQKIEVAHSKGEKDPATLNVPAPGVNGFSKPARHSPPGSKEAVKGSGGAEPASTKSAIVPTTKEASRGVVIGNFRKTIKEFKKVQ